MSAYSGDNNPPAPPVHARDVWATGVLLYEAAVRRVPKLPPTSTNASPSASEKVNPTSSSQTQASAGLQAARQFCRRVLSGERYPLPHPPSNPNDLKPSSLLHLYAPVIRQCWPTDPRQRPPVRDLIQQLRAITRH